MPWNIVTGRDTKRHLKVVEVESGQVVGYAQWILPPVLASKNDVWLEAQVAEVMPEELSLYEQKYQANSRNGGLIGIKSEMMEFRSRPLDEADARIMEHGPFLSRLCLLVADASCLRISSDGVHHHGSSVLAKGNRKHARAKKALMSQTSMVSKPMSCRSRLDSSCISTTGSSW